MACFLVFCTPYSLPEVKKTFKRTKPSKKKKDQHIARSTEYGVTPYALVSYFMILLFLSREAKVVGRGWLSKKQFSIGIYCIWTDCPVGRFGCSKGTERGLTAIVCTEYGVLD